MDKLLAEQLVTNVVCTGAKVQQTGRSGTALGIWFCSLEGSDPRSLCSKVEAPI